MKIRQISIEIWQFVKKKTIIFTKKALYQSKILLFSIHNHLEELYHPSIDKHTVRLLELRGHPEKIHFLIQDNVS